MDMVTRVLSDTLGRTVLDRTGLTGKYEFELEWTPEPSLTGPPAPGDAGAAPTADLSGPSIFTAIQGQLGLRLESGRGPVPVIVIDRIERPSEN
jgi:uncharacterized protein (TIGR03435 family)